VDIAFVKEMRLYPVEMLTKIQPPPPHESNENEKMIACPRAATSLQLALPSIIAHFFVVFLVIVFLVVGFGVAF
jgi:hypothetical protein